MSIFELTLIELMYRDFVNNVINNAASGLNLNAMMIDYGSSFHVLLQKHFLCHFFLFIIIIINHHRKNNPTTKYTNIIINLLFFFMLLFN